jgi:hypothetical protein
MGKFNYKDSDFETVREKAETFYSNVRSVRCPFFKDNVVFNAKGIRHLKFKTDEQARPHRDQYARFKLLPLAPQVLKESHTLQGLWQAKQFEHEKTNGRWERVLRDVTFYEFIAVLDGVRLKVIVKIVGGGDRYFWSVIPFWQIDKGTSRRLLHSGQPDSD